MVIDDNALKLAGILAGVLGVLLTGAFIAIRISKKNTSVSKGNTITQSNNKVGKGDIVGGNKTGQ